MAVGDVYRLQTWLDTYEGHWSFSLFYQEKESPVLVRGAQGLLDAWYSYHWVNFGGSLSGDTQLNCQRAVRVLPRPGIPAQRIFRAIYGLNPQAALAIPAGPRFWIYSALPERSHPCSFMLSGVPWFSAEAVHWWDLGPWTVWQSFAADLAEPTTPIGGDGVWQLQHMAQSIPNGVNTYGTPSDCGQVTVDARVRVEPDRKLDRKGAVATIGP